MPIFFKCIFYLQYCGITIIITMTMICKLVLVYIFKLQISVREVKISTGDGRAEIKLRRE